MLKRAAGCSDGRPPRRSHCTGADGYEALDQKRASGEAIDALNSYSSTVVARLHDEVSGDESVSLRKRRLREAVDLPDLRQAQPPPAFRELPKQLEQRVFPHGL